MEEQNENAEEWMGYLRLKTSMCGYKVKGRSLKEQFFIGISDEEMMPEIIRELTTAKETSKVSSVQVLCSAKK